MRHYVSTAEPVGSKALTQGYNLQVSAATIRNVMSALEESGLLYQPHTSAGRIPSDSGYRIYVNELMASPDPLIRQMESQLSQRLGWSSRRMEILLQEVTQILSSLSGYIALVTLPQMNDACIKHLQLVRVSDDQLLLVVLDTYESHSILISQPTPDNGGASDHELQILSNFLTEQLKGSRLREVAVNWSDLDHAFAQYAQKLQQAIVELAQRSHPPKTTQLLISGLAEVIEQPEFADRSQIRSLIQLLEEGRDQLWPLIAGESERPYSPAESAWSVDTPRQQRLRIWIGTENPVTPMHTCALVASTYGNPSGPVGSLGLLGPTRMLYENAIAAVEAGANYLTEAIAPTPSHPSVGQSASQSADHRSS